MESKVIGVITGLLLLSAMSLGYSTGKMQQHFDQASAKHQDTAKNMANPGQLRPINVKDYATGDTETVAAKNYYDNPEGMETQARAAKESDQSAIAATDVHLNKRQNIDANNPAYKTALGHQANADKILSDSGGRYHCTEVQRPGSQKTTTETCQASNVQQMQCIRYPEVRIIETIIPAKGVPFNGQTTWLASSWGHNRYYHIPIPMTGILKSFTATLKGGWRGHHWLGLSPIINGRLDYYCQGGRGWFSMGGQSEIVLKYDKLGRVDTSVSPFIG